MPICLFMSPEAYNTCTRACDTHTQVHTRMCTRIHAPSAGNKFPESTESRVYDRKPVRGPCETLQVKLSPLIYRLAAVPKLSLELKWV